MHNVSTVKYLGIFVDDRLTFNCHINNIVARASDRANLIHKCFTSKDVTTMTRAFVVYVRPLLELASPVWFPYLLTRYKACRVCSEAIYQALVWYV